MSAIDWKNWLTQWSGELIARLDHDAIDVEEFPDVAPLAEGGITPDDIAARWFGYPGASEAQLVQLEARLNARLPRSYRGASMSCQAAVATADGEAVCRP